LALQWLQQIYTIVDNPAVLFAVMFAAALGNTFFPPIPIEMGTLFAGYLASSGHGSLPVIITSTVFGMTIGSIILYALAWHYGVGLMQKHPFNLLVRGDIYEKSSRWFEKYGVWSLFLAKLVPGISICAVACSGIMRLSKGKAVLGILFSNVFAFSMLAFVGKSIESNWQQAYHWFNRIGLSAFFVICIVIVLAVILTRKLRCKKLS
jgi:membrane protein DedA with SNARE-associated domain